MARKYTERYVRYYTFGSAAAKLEDQQRQAALPKYKAPQKRKPIAFDPFSFAGNAVAILLAVLMVVGFIQLACTSSQVRDMEMQVIALQQEQKMLQELYENGYELEEIRVAAQSMGMVELEDASRVQVHVTQKTEEVQQLGWWDSLLLSLRQFFA